MTALITIDRWLHRVLRGRCWNRWACERLSCCEALRETGAAGYRTTGSTTRTGAST